MKTYEEIDADLQPLSEREQRIKDYLGVPLVDGKRVVTTTNWLTGAYGTVTAENYAPIEKMCSDHLLSELRDFWIRFAPKNNLKGDYIKAIRVAHLIIDHPTANPEAWVSEAQTELRLLRNTAPAYIWPLDEPIDPQIVLRRYRPGWPKRTAP